MWYVYACVCCVLCVLWIVCAVCVEAHSPWPCTELPAVHSLLARGAALPVPTWHALPQNHAWCHGPGQSGSLRMHAASHKLNKSFHSEGQDRWKCAEQTGFPGSTWEPAVVSQGAGGRLGGGDCFLLCATASSQRPPCPRLTPHDWVWDRSAPLLLIFIKRAA